MESLRIYRCDDLINGHVSRVAVANRRTAESTNTLLYSRRFRRIEIVEMDCSERRAAEPRRIVGDQRTTIDDALGAPDQRTTGT